MIASREALDEEALELYWTVVHALQGSTVKTFCQLDLTMAQMKALLVISHDEGVTVSHVGQTLGIGQPAASTLVDRLVQVGWVTRTEDPADRRRTLVRLTSLGQELVERVNTIRREFLRRVLTHMHDDDVAALVQSLRALNEAIAATEP